MRLKLYRAPVMADAMARIRAELGEDALILATRRVGDGVEVTAALEPDEAPLLPPGPQDPARLAALEFHAVPRSLHAALLQGTFDAALAGAMSFATLPLQPGEQPLLLVGPPGAGKTLTVARLATRLVMAGVAPMVIRPTATAPARPNSLQPSPGFSASASSSPATRSPSVAR